jgi:uncharacterized protein (TIGR00725 family)
VTRPAVAVIGGNAPTAREMADAYEVGRLLAQAGVVVICGGLAGVMEAACRGAKSAGGLTVGILPGAEPEHANQYVDVVIPTGIGYARNALVAYSGRAVIAVGGSTGTLSEICFATFRNIPVFSLGSWTVTERPVQMGQPPTVVHTPDEAVAAALKAIGLR